MRTWPKFLLRRAVTTAKTKMKVISDDFVDTTSTKENNVQEILNGNVPEDSLQLDRYKKGSPILSGVSEISEELCLCSAIAIRPQVLQKHGITCIVNATNELPDTPLPHDRMKYFKIPVVDRIDADLQQYFDYVADLIHKEKELGGRTLVHCVAGVSRSATLCIVYMMKYHQKTLLDAYKWVKSKRPHIKPNNGFFRQLIAYEMRLFGTNTVNMVYNEYVEAEIPEVYDSDYQNMILFKKTFNRDFVRR